jgi:transposase
LFGKAGRRFLQRLDLPEASREVLCGYLELLDCISTLIEQVEDWMAAHLKANATVQLLATIPGIGLILAYVIYAEIGEIERFPSRRHLNSYAGLAPVSDDSADRHGRRHCSPACNHALRWALIEAVTGVLNSRGARGQRLQKLYWRLTHGGQSNKNQAKVAVARELSQLVYIIWRTRTPYSNTPPSRPGTGADDRKAVDNPRKQLRVKQAMRSDQPRAPMVRCQPKAVSQTLS